MGWDGMGWDGWWRVRASIDSFILLELIYSSGIMYFSCRGKACDGLLDLFIYTQWCPRHHPQKLDTHVL